MKIQTHICKIEAFYLSFLQFLSLESSIQAVFLKRKKKQYGVAQTGHVIYQSIDISEYI